MTDRWQFSVEEAFIEWGTGAAWDASTDKVKESICIYSEGTLRGPAIVVQGAIGWGLEVNNARIYREYRLCTEVGMNCPEEAARPSLEGYFDPEGNPM